MLLENRSNPAESSAMTGKLEGIFVPMLVPYDEGGEVNEAELRRFIRWLIEDGVHGLYPNGSTGEATRLTADERRLVTKITCEEAAGKVPVIAGMAEANARESLRACEHAASCGAAAVAIVAPFFYRLTQDSVYAYFAEIARNSPINIVLYNIPSFANPIAVETVQRLAELPRVVGIKDSSGDVPSMMRMIAAIRPSRPEFSFLTGWDPVLVTMLLAGCNGGTNATANVIPQQMRQMFELFRAGDVQAAIRLQHRILPAFDLMLQSFEFPDGFRAGAELNGFSFGFSRVPQTSHQSEERATRKRRLGALLCELGSRT